MFRARLLNISEQQPGLDGHAIVRGSFDAWCNVVDLSALRIGQDIVFLSQQEYARLLSSASIPQQASILIQNKCNVCETNDAIQNGIRCRACITAKRTTKIPTIPAISKETDRFNLIELE